MGIWDWIKNAAISASVGEKERAYWWVSEARRKKCRKIIDESWRSANTLTLAWDDWHRCMQEEPKPLSEYKVIKDFRFLVNFILELVGVREKIVVEEIPPTIVLGTSFEDCVKNKKSAIYHSEGCQKYREKYERQLEEGKRIEKKRKKLEEKIQHDFERADRLRKEKERKQKDKYGKKTPPKKPTIIKPKKPIRRRVKDRSHLRFNLFAGALRWRNLAKPEFLLRFENIGDKILEEISIITGEKK